MRIITILLFTCSLTVLFGQNLSDIGSLKSKDLAQYMIPTPKKATSLIQQLDSTFGRTELKYYDSLVKQYEFTNTLNFYKYSALFDYRGNQINVSGLVIKPQNNIREKDVIYFHGTRPPFKNLVKPSDFDLKDKPKKMFFELKYMMKLADLGYTIFVPDYIGYAESEHVEHPYTVYEPNVEAAYNSYKSLKRNFSNVLGAEKPLISLGVSEGGSYALGLHKYVESIDKNAEIKSYPCEGPYDYKATLEWVFDGKPKTKFGILIYVWSAYSVIDYYSPESNLKDSLFLINNIEQKKIIKITRLLGKNNSPYKYFNKGYVSQILSGENQQMNEVIEKNIIYKDWSPRGGVFLFHSGQDQVVPVVNTENTYEYLKQRSDKVKYEYFPERGHRTLGDSYFGYLINELK